MNRDIGARFVSFHVNLEENGMNRVVFFNVIRRFDRKIC